MDDKTPFINDFANRSFRDLADQDYIMARIAYRKSLDQQFRWCALQAIEKYLKAILLYNRVSARGLSHNLNKALNRVKSIEDIEFKLPSDDIEKFIDYLNSYGDDRYLSHPTYLPDNALLTLDKAIWCIRRYCFFMHQEIENNGKKYYLLESNKDKTTSAYYENNRHKYKLFGGYLEKVIKDELPSYQDLVWKNFFYGRVKKNKIKNFTSRISSQNPTHSLHPDVFEELSSLVDFPKKVKKVYNES